MIIYIIRNEETEQIYNKIIIIQRTGIRAGSHGVSCWAYGDYL